MSVVKEYMNEFGIGPDVTIDLREVVNERDQERTRHRHVVVICEDGSEMWLDIGCENKDHNFVDIRWMNPAGEMKGTGVFTIVNGDRGQMTPELPDTEGRIVRGHKWSGGYVTTLLVDKNGQEETAIKPSPGNG